LTPRARRIAFLATLVLAAVLRFTALGWGLRHTPVRDEQDFVENVGRMLQAGDWDHRFYEYPGLFFDILRPILSHATRTEPYFSEWSGFKRRTFFGPSGYLLARGVVAAFGVGSVALTYRLGLVLIGPEGALVAAALLAASPVEVFVGHEVRPDVVLEFFVLLALLTFQRLGPRTGDDAVAGLAVGAAAAVKFTGILLAPAYLIARLLIPGTRVRGLAAAALAAAGLWFCATPYALVNSAAFLKGTAFQVGWHYRGHGLFPHPVQVFLYYLRTGAWSLGPLAAALGLAGLVAARTKGRAWAPVLAYPVLMLAVFSSAEAHWHRLVLSGLGIAALVAGLGFDSLRLRSPRLAWITAAAAVLFPLGASSAYLRGISVPSPRDLVVDWAETHLPARARILNTVHELGLDRTRFEVIQETGSPGLDRLLARQSDLVIWRWPNRATVEGFETVWRSKPRLRGGAFGEMPEVSLVSQAQPIVLFQIPESLRLTYRTVPLDGAALSGSANSDQSANVVDGRLETSWSTEGPQRPSDWFQILLPRRVRLGRIEMLLGDKPQRAARGVRVAVTDDGTSWTWIASANARPAVEEQLDRDSGGASQLLVIEPVWTRGVRLRAGAFGDRPWGFADLRLESVDADEP
jgi:4-amino-4-deoxy-L-arabinose transferase-like glycosyltransferase